MSAAIGPIIRLLASLVFVRISSGNHTLDSSFFLLISSLQCICQAILSPRGGASDMPSRIFAVAIMDVDPKHEVTVGVSLDDSCDLTIVFLAIQGDTTTVGDFRRAS